MLFSRATSLQLVLTGRKELQCFVVFGALSEVPCRPNGLFVELEEVGTCFAKPLLDSLLVGKRQDRVKEASSG